MFFAIIFQTKMVQHIRKKHPEFAQLPNTLHTPLTTAVISATPAVLTTDSATGETVVVSACLVSPTVPTIAFRAKAMSILLFYCLQT